MIKRLALSAVFLVGLVLFVTSSLVTQAESPPLSLNILSSQTLSGTAGDYVTVKAEIQNPTIQPIANITTYLSLVDTQTKLPVDLEDWSAEKGLFIGTIDGGQTLPLEWKIHFVKPGEYNLAIIADEEGQNQPIASTITHFTVAPKHNLNPGKVLPVVLGIPILLVIMLMLFNYRRTKIG